jgi:hypothetical protein
VREGICVGAAGVLLAAVHCAVHATRLLICTVIVIVVIIIALTYDITITLRWDFIHS